MAARIFRLKESTHVNAPIDRCFLLSTNVALVQKTIGLTPRTGKTSGLIAAGDRVTWRGWKFGLPAFHETLITAYDRPDFFQDSMARGRFSFFQHDHRFQEVDGHTLLIDVVRFSLPFGVLGGFVAKRILVPHILKLMRERFYLLKRLAEGNDWRQYTSEPHQAAQAPRTCRLHRTARREDSERNPQERR